MEFSEFPKNVRFTPVPNHVFGPLLEQINDLSELKCTLRIIWLINQKKGYMRYVTLDELIIDKVLARAIDKNGVSFSTKIQSVLDQTVNRGTLITCGIDNKGSHRQIYMVNTDHSRKIIDRIRKEGTSLCVVPRSDPDMGAVSRPNIFVLYEDNIGVISPMIAEELIEAEKTYSIRWIEEAFREAVGNNKRNWRYIARILERWETEGKQNGNVGRYPKENSYY